MFTSFILEKPDVWFRRPFQEVKGYRSFEKDGSLFIQYNVLGLGESDINISLEPSDFDSRSVLSVSGEKRDDKSFDWKVSYKLLIKTPESIEANVENGVLTVEIKYPEPIKPDVKINWKNTK